MALTLTCAVACVAVGFGAAACSSSQNATPNGTGGAGGGASAALPSYAEVRAAHNTRVARLGQLSARGITTFRYRNAEGREEADQGDLLLRYTAPDKLALVIKKLGETYVWVGADATRYWFIDRLSETPAAYVGRHDKLDAEKASRLVMPVPPRDMMTLLALRPMPESGGELRWSADGRNALVRVPAGETFASEAGGGSQQAFWVYSIDPDTLLPSGVALVADEGESQRTLLLAEITSYARAARSATIPASTDAPLVARDVRIRVPGEPENIRVMLDSTGILLRGSRPSVFSFEDCVDTLGVSEIVDLDAEPAAFETGGGGAR
jgi:hypothetical protein